MANTGGGSLFFCALFGFIFAASVPPDRFSNEFREGGGKRGGEIEREREKGAAGQETRGGREGAFEIKGSVGHPPRTSGQLK